MWFKEPWDYFNSYVSPVGVNTDTFWSDDGQRGMRYAPYYGNSGFYYIKYNPRTEYWAWMMITAFDTMHTSGSHQNVVTTRLMETMDLFNVTVKLLDIDLFPTGVKYHHDPEYMKGMKEGKIVPYHYHMCWTTNKGDKLRYFKNTRMWYLTDQCEHDGVRPHGGIFQEVMRERGIPKQWDKLTASCCKSGL